MEKKTKPEKKVHTVPARANPTTELKIGLPIDSNNQYAASYLKNCTHGVVYQTKLLTWVTWKLMCQNDAKIGNWWLATEVTHARGFHDLVLKYDTPKADGSISDKKYMYRFMQMKHKRSLKKNAEITDYFLTSQNKLHREGSLFHLFRCYLNILGSFEKITPDQIEDLTIFTNMKISGFEFLVPVKNDGLYDFEGKGKRFRLDTRVLLKQPRIMIGLYGIKKQMTRNRDDDEEIILGFLKKLVFSVSQPSEHELDELIVAEMGKTFNTPQIFYDNLYKNIINWFLIYNGGKAPYLTENHVMKYLKETQDILRQYILNNEMLVEPVSKLSDKFKSFSL